MRDRRGVGRQLLRIAAQTEPDASAQLVGDEALAAAAPAVVRLMSLLERLVQLHWLERLMISLVHLQLPAVVLAAWVQPGAFPQLKE